jgi:uncharacterized cupredoxin-like copper-binding protein
MSTIWSVIAAALLAAAGAVHAHGDEEHGKSGAPARKEQKAWGIAGDAQSAGRTVEVRMLDTMRFVPGRIDVRLGETVRFVVRNDGKTMHEFVIGTTQENDAHAELMLKHPGMEHDEPYMAHVAPGKAGEIVWTFNRAGEFDFACLIAGHYQAGMIGRIQVAGGDHAGQHRPAASAAAGDMADGEVREIDKAAGKVTLKHGEIRSLDMPGMTMVFQVKEPALLDAVKAGDRVRFKAEKSGASFVVTEMTPVK